MANNWILWLGHIIRKTMGHVTEYRIKSCYTGKHATRLPIFCIFSHSTSSDFFQKASFKWWNIANCSLAGKNTVSYKSWSTLGTKIELVWKKCDHAFKNCIIILMENRGKSSVHGYHLHFCNFFTFPTCEFTTDDSQMMWLIRHYFLHCIHTEVALKATFRWISLPSVLQLYIELVEAFKLEFTAVYTIKKGKILAVCLE